MQLHTALLFASVLAGPASAQSDSIDLPVSGRGADVPAFELPNDLVLFDAPNPGTLHAAGATWKATFGAEGMTYVPFLGSDAPRNYPVSFEVAGARVGERHVALDAAPTVRREGDRVLIDRGAVVEVYDCSASSVEQSFLFPFRTRSGEVVVTLDVRTDLEGRGEGAELAFGGPDGDVRYGAAFAFDQAGRRADVSRRFDGGTIELTVPAVFPVEEGNVLTLDPLISTRAISPPGHSSRTADVAFEKDIHSGGAYYVVYERFFSSGDTDAYVASFDPVTGIVSSPVALDISSDSWRNVRIAANDGNDQFLAVAQVEPAAGGNRRICGRFVEDGLSVGSVFSVNQSAGTRDAFLPDVGGERVPFIGSGYLVVWEETGLFDRGNIMGRVVNANGALPGDDIAISASWAIDEGAPRVSATTGEYQAGPSLFNVAWELDAPTGRRVRAAQVRFDGLITQPAFSVTPSGVDCHSPSVSSTHPNPLADVGTRPFLVAYTEETSDGGDVMLAVCDENGGLGLHNLSEREGVAFNTDQQDPVIAETGDSWIVAYSEFDSVGVLRFKTYMMTLHLTETGGAPDVALAERHVLLSASPAVPHSEEPAIAGEAEMGGHRDDALVLWGDRNPSGSIFSNVRAAHVDAHSSSGAIGVQYCQPTYNSTAETGWLSAFGSQAPSGLKVLAARDLPPFSVSFFLAANQPGNVLQPGGSVGRLCVGGSIGRYSSFAAQTTSNGTTFMLLNPTQIAQPGGPTAATAGERWYFQLWHRDSVGGQSVSNFTNAVAIDFR